MTDCTCPEDRKTIDKADRLYVYEPGADVQVATAQGIQRQCDASKVHIFHKECPKHGYEVLEKE